MESHMHSHFKTFSFRKTIENNIIDSICVGTLPIAKSGVALVLLGMLTTKENTNHIKEIMGF